MEPGQPHAAGPGMFDSVARNEDAWTEFEAAKSGQHYETPLPAEAEPPFDIRLG